MDRVGFHDGFCWLEERREAISCQQPGGYLHNMKATLNSKYFREVAKDERHIQIKFSETFVGKEGTVVSEEALYVGGTVEVDVFGGGRKAMARVGGVIGTVKERIGEENPMGAMVPYSQMCYFVNRIYHWASDCPTPTKTKEAMVVREETSELIRGYVNVKIARTIYGN
ncbi:hypothetical protein GWK47_038865 [Chionoecetes opilio]|uniref:Uncharacterized protein n=1 Tax=Chionoecetes opilio TaxID=41210 RepID=A0A8J4YMH0_CHIOP|nr:hypothetical protein GWK47_038865 [Chionoecetes opilio]